MNSRTTLQTTLFTGVTISGGICTGKSTLVKNLVKELQWETYSSGAFFREYAHKHNLSIEKAEEQTPHIAKKIDYMVRRTLKNKKHIIVDAWMGGIMAQGISHVLKVLLICDDRVRYKRFSKREGIPLQASKEHILERENNLLQKLSTMYKVDDILQPSKYNIVINTTDLSVDKVTRLVLCLLHTS